jgi:hypothetical protein
MPSEAVTHGNNYAFTGIVGRRAVLLTLLVVVTNHTPIAIARPCQVRAIDGGPVLERPVSTISRDHDSDYEGLLT